MFHWYGFFIGLAIAVGYSLAEKIEPKVSRVGVWVLVLGILGARMWHVGDMWEYYQHNMLGVLKLWEGGLSIWGALIGGGVGFVIGERREERGERWKMLAAIVTALPLSQAIGRVGNGVNGEFVNKVGASPWWGAEAILDLILFGVLWGLTLRGVSSQAKVFAYLVGYGVIRLVLQPYRM